MENNNVIFNDLVTSNNAQCSQSADSIDDLFDVMPLKDFEDLVREMLPHMQLPQTATAEAPGEPPAGVEGSIGSVPTGSLLSTTSFTTASTSTRPPTRSMGFPEALYNVVNNPFNSCHAMWNQSGTAFRYRDEHQLLLELRAQGIKARSSASVAKNLNDFRFKRHSDARRRQANGGEDGWAVFSHPAFRRGNPEEAKGMKRKGKGVTGNREVVQLYNIDNVWQPPLASLDHSSQPAPYSSGTINSNFVVSFLRNNDL